MAIEYRRVSPECGRNCRKLDRHDDWRSHWPLRHPGAHSRYTQRLTQIDRAHFHESAETVGDQRRVGNLYPGTATPVRDFGTGNRY
jgi:hypothetical protein